MANNSNISINVNANLNGLGIVQSNNQSTTPVGSIGMGESVIINAGSYQQVFTGSAGSVISSVTVFNTGATGSLLISASGVVLNSLVYPGQASSIAINSLLPSLMVSSSVATTGSFIIIPQ